MQKVADAAGLSVGLISQIERGLTHPSLSSLTSIAEVLQAPMGQLLDAMPKAATPAPIDFDDVVSRRQRLSDPEEGSGMLIETRHEVPGIAPACHSHSGEEFLYVISGQCTLRIDGEDIVLMPGQSKHFSSLRPHAIWNHGVVMATLLWCLTRPDTAPNS